MSGERTKLTDTLTSIQGYDMIDNVDVKTYFEDPVLTFEDSTIYGCSIELNLEEFKNFCNSNMFQHLMLF